MIAELSFNRSWLFGGSGFRSLSVDKFINFSNREFGDGVTVQSRSTDECVLEINAECSADELKEKLERFILDNILGDEKDKSVFSLVVRGAEEQESEKRSNSTTSDSQSLPFSGASGSEASPDASTENALCKIDALIGADDFKSLCHEIHDRAALILKHNSLRAFFSGAFLFSVSAGGGYSNSIKLLNELMVEEGLFEKSNTVIELTPPSPEVRELRDEMQNFRGKMGAALNSPRILSIDIEEWLSHTNHPEFKNMLLHIFRENKKSLICFRAPEINEALLSSTCKDLDDIISTRAITLKPFSMDELHKLAKKTISEYGYSFSDDIWPVFDDLVREERGDGYFYGIYTVRKIVNKMLHCMELHCAQTDSDEQIITSEIVASIAPAPIESGVSGLEMLDELVGMDEIKAQVEEIVNQILLARGGNFGKLPCMHMRFTGNPGTGKTTIARILGKIFKDSGVLRLGKLYEHSGRDLCGQYVGHTAPKTRAICQEAYGSILFIDEAYSLFRGESSSVDYGREAIDTLIAEMENHSDDLLVIFAGYPDDMDTLMHANSGMASRIPYTISFPNYSREQLCQIFLRMSSKFFNYGEDYSQRAAELFQSLPDSLLQSRAFGNARFCRNLYERVWGKAAKRSSVADIKDIVLKAEDIDSALESMSFDSLEEKTIAPIGFNYN